MLGLIAGLVGLVSSLATTVGPAIATVAKTIVALAPTLEKIIAVGNVISGIAQILGVLNPGENTEDLGAKAMQDGTRPRMQDESAESYLNYLRNDVVLDKTKQAHMSESDRMACIATGSALVMATAAEKSGLDLTPEYVANVSKAGVSASAAWTIASKFKENNVEINKFNEYFSNELSGQEVLEVNQTLKESVKEINPDMSDKEIRAEINNMGREISASEV